MITTTVIFEIKKDPFLITAILLSKLSNSNRPKIEKIHHVNPNKFRNYDEDFYQIYNIF